MGTGVWRSGLMVRSRGLRRVSGWGLDVEVHDVQGVLFDELAARLHRVAHQDREHLVGADRILEAHLQERARLGIHGRLPELIGVHLAESLVALKRGALPREIHHGAHQLLERVGPGLLAAAVDDRAPALVERRDLRVDLEELRVIRRSEQVDAERDLVRAREVHSRPVAVVAAHTLHRPPRRGGRGGGERRRELGIVHSPLRRAELAAQERVQHGARDATPAELREQRAELDHALHRLKQALLAERCRPPRHLDACLVHPLGEQELLHLALAHEVALDAPLLDLEERRLGDEQVARLDHLHHVAEEERQEQRADVRTIHVGIRHQDDLVVSELPDLELLGAYARAERGDQQANFLVREHLVVTRLLGVDDLSAQRQDRLRLAISSLLGRSASRIALDEENLAKLRIALGAIRELCREPLVVAPALARQLARLARGLPRLRRAHALVGDLPRGGRILLEHLAQPIVDDLLHEAPHLGVPQLRLGLTLELGLGNAHGHDRGESLTDVVARHAALETLQESLGLRIARDRARQCRAKSREVRAALARVDVVREREHVFLVAVVVLERHLDLDAVLLALEAQDARVDRRLVLVQMLDELDDAALVEEDVTPLVPLVLDRDLQALVQERELAQPVRERVERERHLLEYFCIRLEADNRTVLGRLLPRCDLALRHAALVALRPHVALTPDLDLEPLGERIDHRDANAVQPARNLVGRVLELATRVQNRQHDLRRRLAALLVQIDGNASAVVPDRARPIGMQDDLDAVAVAGERLVHGVVDGLVDEMVQPVRARVADVHRRALAHGLEALEDLDVAGVVSLDAHATPFREVTPAPLICPWLTSHQIAVSTSGSVRSAVVSITWPAVPR